MSRTRTLGIFIFPDVEVLDFCGPYEVFSVTGHQVEPGSFRVLTVGETAEPLAARNGLKVIPDVSFADCPPLDVVLIPGGQGTRPLLYHDQVLAWIYEQAGVAELVLSVCTGSLLLAKAGLLDGLEATTHHLALDLLREVGPQATVRDDVRVVDNGRVITSAGVASGIDMSFHVVAKLLGQEVAERVAKYIEYPWPRQL
jgi:transcriptional regulator GlxA family with amidase domain